MSGRSRRAPAPASPKHEPGLVADRYLLGRELGRGSSAVVYEATDQRLNRHVTLKLLEPEVAMDPAQRARFEQQAHKAALLVHPHVAAVLDAGFTADAVSEQPFVVMEPAGGRTLRHLLDEQGQLNPGHAVRLARQIALAVEYAHRQGVIHANLKPENVLLDRDGQTVKVVDFSLSFVSARTGLVTAGTLARRAAYLAPEQVRGDHVTEQSDVYSLGAVLYEMLTGRPPFTASTPQQAAERRVHELPRPAGNFEPTIPQDVEQVVSRALEREPSRRWASAAELDAALATLDRANLQRAEVPDAAEPLAVSRLAPPAPSAVRGHRALALLLTAAATAAGLGLIATLVSALLGGPSLAARISGGGAVPDLVGISLDEARAIAVASGYTLQVTGERPSDRFSRGRVVQQAPVAGFKSPASLLSFGFGDEQLLRVSLSAGVVVPDVRGKSLVEATARLQEFGWRVSQVDRGPHPGFQRDTVALQFPPPEQVMEAAGSIRLAVAN